MSQSCMWCIPSSTRHNPSPQCVTSLRHSWSRSCHIPCSSRARIGQHSKWYIFWWACFSTFLSPPPPTLIVPPRASRWTGRGRWGNSTRVCGSQQEWLATTSSCSRIRYRGSTPSQTGAWVPQRPVPSTTTLEYPLTGLSRCNTVFNPCVSPYIAPYHHPWVSQVAVCVCVLW